MQDTILSRVNDMIISGIGCPTAEEVAHLEAIYPLFLLPVYLRLARATDMNDEERMHLERRAALSSGDKEALFKLIDEHGKDFVGFYPPEETTAAPSTDSAIDTFLETYGTTDAKETALLERLIFNPTPEYAATLAKEDTVAAEGQDAVLDAFLKEFSPEANPQQLEEEEELRRKEQAENMKKASPSEDSLLTESLAKIYISRGKYDKAYEIIHTLSLNYPKKSIYFADQLRFLQKLILNSKHKK